MHWAVRLYCPQNYHYSTKVITTLLNRGADVNAVDKNNSTPLHDAAKAYGSSAIQVVTLLLRHGADVNAVDNDNNTPLSIAVKSGKSSIAEILSRHMGMVSVPGYFVEKLGVFCSVQ